MSLLPRTLPDRTRQKMTEALAAAGITVTGPKPGTRLTLIAEYQEQVWELTYLNLSGGDGWRVTGPGAEHGIAAFLDDVPQTITTGAAVD